MILKLKANRSKKNIEKTLIIKGNRPKLLRANESKIRIKHIPIKNFLIGSPFHSPFKTLLLVTYIIY